jgi:hypothetical protein
MARRSEDTASLEKRISAFAYIIYGQIPEAWGEKQCANRRKGAVLL